MTNEEFDKRMDRLTERHEAMAVSMELLQSTVHELSGTMRSLVHRDADRAERDKRYLLALSGLLKSWAGENGNGKD